MTLFAFTGLNVVEVAHNTQLPVSKYITGSMALTNPFDTWHGTKNVDKCGKLLKEGSRTVVSTCFLNLLITVSVYDSTIVICRFIPREE
jgi:hypothetical protein